MNPAFITYAHRGASTYCPENTAMSFYTGLYMGANGIETDVQLTKDGVPVLFHDDTLERVMGVEGRLADYTYRELCTFPIRHNGKVDYILTLDEFFKFFSKQEITFAIELKGADTEQAVADMIRKYDIAEKCIATSFQFAYLEKMKTLFPQLRLGFLALGGAIDDALLTKMQALSFYEICPKATDITPERVAYWHSLGFNVRAWGVSNEEIMRTVYNSGADGATVNFPDKMLAYIEDSVSAEE